jgi:hypothetical protein
MTTSSAINKNSPIIQRPRERDEARGTSSEEVDREPSREISGARVEVRSFMILPPDGKLSLYYEGS